MLRHKLENTGVRNRAAVWVASVLIVAVLFVPSCSSRENSADKAKKHDPNKALVKVNGQVVTIGDFEIMFKRLMPDGVEGISEDDIRELKKNLLMQLVDEAIIEAEAAKMMVTIGDDDVEKEITALKAAYGDKDFNDAIVQRYESLDNWKAEISKKLLIRKTIDAAVGKKVKVTEKEALDYYERNRANYDVPEQVHAKMILVKSEKAAKRAFDRLKVDSFEEVAKNYSVSPEGKEGGDLGYFGRGDMPIEFESAVFALKPGEVSTIIKTAYGYHIFKLVDKKEGGKLGFNDVKAKIIEKLKTERSEEAYNVWMAGLKKNAKLEINSELL